MTDRESRLLFGVLALQLNYISKEQLVGALAAWSEKPQRDIADILIERKYISEQQREAVTGLVSAHLARTSGRGLPAGQKFDPRETVDTVVMPRTGGATPAGRPESAPLVSNPGDRFQLGPEIGRGGLARVVEAQDGDIGRTVALKLMLEDAPGDALERFQYEARVTGRLEHPNIVPVHEVGVLPGGKEIFFCMKRIYGRDMHQVIREGKWKQRKLVEALRDVCHAVAYAHSKGVIHRDVKPSNVMLGDFGEVLVVDWGLAIVKGGSRPEAAARASETARGLTEPITEEGEILGTPAYMPPEQAMGMRDSIDERSDVYSLGSILYEILTERPPFEGRSPSEVVKKVASMPLMPPSSRVPACPFELESICLRAMARKQEDRYPGAAELAADLEAYLEGTKERERREALATEQLTRARSAIARWKRLLGEGGEASIRAEKLGEEIPEYEGLERKRELWAVQDTAKGLERDAITGFTEADAALTSALSNVPGHREARELKAEIYWARFLETEAAGDERGMQLNRQTAEQFNDGILDARLRGDGTIAMRTRAYPCRCLVHGRQTRPEELSIRGLHAWTGNASPESTPQSLQLKLHGATCHAAPLAGAQVWAFRIEEVDRLLIPVTAHSGTNPVPRAALDALFGDSPFRPRGVGTYLGRTPIPKQPWPMGSWLLVVVAEGRAPQRVPVHLGRQQDLDLEVTLWAPNEIPGGFLPVAAGPFRYGDPTGLGPHRVLIHEPGDFFLARQPVTCREYATFLNELLKAAPDEAARRAPRTAEKSGFYWPLTPAGYAVPTEAWLATASPDARAAASRLTNVPADWDEEWPVCGISWDDSMAYARWASFRDGRCYHLPHEIQWEKSARGADARLFPWGSHFVALWANTGQSRKTGQRPDPIRAFPWDESPYGLRGLGGNTSDRCLNEPNDNFSGRRITRGGNWARTGAMVRATYRSGADTASVNMAIGVRLAMLVVGEGSGEANPGSGPKEG